MYANIEVSKVLVRALGYNEKKIEKGKAERIGAENFLKDYPDLTKQEIIDRFWQRSSFNELHQGQGLHISLNFGKTEQLDNEKMVLLTNRYMTGMGLEDQPYVAYRHHDAGHTHLHIVASNIRADGQKIRLLPQDFHASKSLCEALEREFNLERSTRATLDNKREFEVDHAQRVTYGEPGLKRSISDVLNTVFPHYIYTSIDEYNAVLRQYNVEAYPGIEDSRIRRTGGLLYRALDNEGNKIGIPIKASLFLLKPTLKNLEQRFEQNQTLRESARQRVATAIDWALAGRAPNWDEFKAGLEKDGIAVITRKESEGKAAVFFIDHNEKCVFAAKNLGPGYESETLRNRCAPEEQQTEEQSQRQHLNLRL
jgi:Relaxase/Mobilisation nuclease domain